MKKALIIMSGGQDSVTCLYWALNRFDKVEAITFDYGQKHSVEIESAISICDREKVKHTIIDISFLDTLVESALTSNGDCTKTNENGLPTSFVPNRNQLFITLSHAYAQKIGANTLVTGVCQTDYSGYPDCRLDFITAIERTSNLGSGIIEMEKLINIETPLMHLTKAQTFQLAKDEGCLEVVVNESHTCYNGDTTPNDWGKGCGECPACKLRAKGYEEFMQR